jgi:thiosulfate/3-mercaptopyruvate sulfurtransferase
VLVRRSCLALVLAAAIAPLSRAQHARSPRDAMLISTASLAARLNDPSLVLLHVGDENEYRASHLPGARFVTLDDVAESDRSGQGLTLEMPAPDALRDRLAALGISDASHVVIYFGNDRVTASTRIFLTLAHAGLGDRTRLLDGGMPQWIREGRPVTDVVPPPRTGHLSPLHVTANVVDADYVRTHIGRPGTSIVDARAAAFYDGVQAGRGRGGPQRAGHIVGAKSVPFDSPYDRDNRLLSNERLAALFATAGVAPGDTVVGYCHIGQQATAMLFAARAIGHPILLYDGSFEDWSRRAADAAPVDNPSAKGQP